MACLTPSSSAKSRSSAGVNSPFVAVRVPDSMTSRSRSTARASRLRPLRSWSLGRAMAVLSLWLLMRIPPRTLRRQLKRHFDASSGLISATEPIGGGADGRLATSLLSVWSDL